MKLLFSPFSPYVRKCLVTAAELGLDGRIELRPSSAHPINRDQAIIVDNPLGKVPTFFTDDGQVLYDSRVICEYLNDLAGGSLFPAGAARWQSLTLQSLGDGMLDAEALETALGYIAAHPDIWEVILTGGDPLVLSPRRIAALTARLDTIAHVKIQRWHTRLPIVDPARIDHELCTALRAARAATWMVVHVNHPRELTAQARVRFTPVAAALRSQLLATP